MNTTTRFALRLFCVLLLGGAITVAVLNQNALTRARAEQQALIQDQAECERLTAENAQLVDLRATNEAVQKLILANKDLPRLRNEIRRLREAAGEAEKLRADNQRLSAAQNNSTDTALPADFLRATALAYAGLTSPEATLQTFFHAAMQGDVRRANQCQLQPEVPDSRVVEAQDVERLQKEYARFPGFRIAEKTVLGPDEVQIGVQSAPGGVIAPIKLKLVATPSGNEWKIEPNNVP